MTTEAAAGFQSPEEAALDLELPLLGTLPSPSDESGPIAPRVPDDERARRENHRAADRILLSPLSRGGSIGILGDVSSLRRARIIADLAAALSSEKTSILVDADLTGAHLSFDERGRAQEGLVDVLRYGVRSPRVVAPTQAPGLNLLPVGSGTVDLASTYGSESTASLFAELRRTGDLVIVNGPDLAEMESAGSFLQEVGAWILVHEFGVSLPNRTRALKEALGHSACLGVLAIVPEMPKSAEMPAPTVAEKPAAEAPAETPAGEAGWTGSGESPYASFRAQTTALPPPPPLPPRETAEAPLEETLFAVEPRRAEPPSPVEEPAFREPFDPTPPPPAPSADPPLEIHEPVEPSVTEGMAAPTEKTSVGGAFEPIRAVPPEGAAQFETPSEAPGREGLSDRYELRDEESIAIEEAIPPSKRGGGSTKILAGVLLLASLAVAALFWFGGRGGTPPAPLQPPPGRLASGPSETDSPKATGPPAAKEPVVPERVASGPAAQQPSVDESAAQRPLRTRSDAPPPANATPITGKPAAPPLKTGAGSKPSVPPLGTAAGSKPAVATAGSWGVHVTSMLTEDGAQRELDLLKGSGYAAVARHVKVDAKGFWFRIYVGPFDTKEDAERVARKLKESGVREYAMAKKIPGEGTGREDR